VPVSVIQRQDILTLLKDGLGNQEIAAQVGVSPGTLAAVKAHISMGTYAESSVGADTETEVASAVDTAFGLERNLQMALRLNMTNLKQA
jgi:hypothetical protein